MATEVRTATQEEAEAVGRVMTLAFAADPPMRFIWSSPADYLRWYPALVRAMTGRGFEHGAATVTADLRAAAVWLPPSVEPDAEAVGALAAEAIPPEKLQTMAAVMEQMHEHHPTEPHWYLPMIGVDPAMHGRGHGSALLKHTLRLCDEQGLPAYLESSKPQNIPFYERHGFEPIATIAPDDFPPVTPMYRAARG